ncbi:MAG TPA: sulfatase-like hydrolase/transferase [Chthoniobacter sp.]|jgi:arylsulfatase A-like enzyme
MKLPPLLLIAAVALASQLVRAAEPKPNILVILSDDQGYADTGFQGCKDIPTPNLDRLAHEGLRCTNGYVSHPYCSPSRAGLMTGRYQARFGHEHNPRYDPNDHREGLPTTEKLLPQFLQAAGYATGWIGKWHLGAAPEFLPENRGFQETFGFIGGIHHFQNWKVDPTKEPNLPLFRNGKQVDVTEHLTVAFGHEAASFVQRHQKEPWFLYLAFNAPHDPEEPTAERLRRFASIEDRKRRAYAAQVSLLDDAIGEALTTLRETGQEQRTLVFFFSDNGAPFGDGHGGSGPNGGVNTPLRDGKHSVYEGGVRVPFVASWPGHLPSGKDYDLPVSSLDVFATALACANIPMPTDRPYDGVNLIPYLKGEKTEAPHPQLFWRANERLQAAARSGSWKLVRDGTWRPQLFDLATDIGESNDVSKQNAQATGEVNGALDAWMKQMSTKLAFPGQQGPEKLWPEPEGASKETR